MDGQWTLLGVPIGWDALIGLLPIAGDTLTACVSLSLVNKARKMRVPKRLLLRMLTNVAIDFFGGALPVFGDVFDLAWRANSKNLSLLEEHYGLESSGAGLEAKASYLKIMLLGLLVCLATAVCFTYQQQLYSFF